MSYTSLETKETIQFCLWISHLLFIGDAKAINFAISMQCFAINCSTAPYFSIAFYFTRAFDFIKFLQLCIDCALVVLDSDEKACLFL